MNTSGDNVFYSETTRSMIDLNTNATLNEFQMDQTKIIVEGAVKIVIIVIVAIIMMSLGCTIEIGVLKQHIKKPLPAIIGMTLQFFVYPAVVFGVVQIFQVKPHHALGMLLIATSPGGSFSNLITYWARGDVVLSVCMTSFSTIIATGMMPLNLYIYTRSYTSVKLVVPYVKIIIALVFILIPVSIGMLLMRKCPKIAKIIIDIGGATGFIFILIVSGLQFYLYPHILNATWKLWFAGVLLPIFGLLVGYVGSLVTCLNQTTCRTVAIEVSAQNVALCFTIIFVSFEAKEAIKIITFPCIYGVMNVIVMVFVVLVCRIMHVMYQKYETRDIGNEEETSKINICQM